MIERRLEMGRVEKPMRAMGHAQDVYDLGADGNFHPFNRIDEKLPQLAVEPVEVEDLLKACPGLERLVWL